MTKKKKSGGKVKAAETVSEIVNEAEKIIKLKAPGSKKKGQGKAGETGTKSKSKSGAAESGTGNRTKTASSAKKNQTKGASDTGNKIKSASGAKDKTSSKSASGTKDKTGGPRRSDAIIKEAGLKEAGYEEVSAPETLKDYEVEISESTVSAKAREYLRLKQIEINALEDEKIKLKKSKAEKTGDTVAKYREKQDKAAGKSQTASGKRRQKSGKTALDAGVKDSGAENGGGSAAGKSAVPAKKPGIGSGKVRIIFLGGLEQIGMNITAFETDESIVVVDCGMAFPDSSMPGIDLVIPDISYLEEHMSKVRGFFITHGHEDHIGALPYALQKLNVPVYATRLTRALIELKLREKDLLDTSTLITVEFGDVIEAGDFAVEYIKTNHSIQDAAAIALHTPAGTILHTGDFKVDFTPVHGDTIDLQRFAELGKQGVLALLCDSTNAARPGFTMSERTVGHTFDSIFSEYRDRRLIIATFASNVDRVQQIISAAEKYGRKAVIDGRSMVNVIGVANELGYIRVEPGTLIDIAEMKNYPDEQVVLIVTGSQGEPMAALSRMAQGQHKKVYLSENDVIVLSSAPIPGNEKSVSRIVNELSRKHTTIINQDTHVSGHACAEDIKLIYSLVHPRFAIPVHGEFRHRLAQKVLAEEVGVPSDNVILADVGDVVDITAEYCTVSDQVQAGPVLVDGLGVGDIGNIVLRDRQSLARNGIIIAALTFAKDSGQLISGPDIVTRGFVYVRENEDLIEEARQIVLDAVDDCMLSGKNDWPHIKNVIKEELNEFIWRRMKRTPMILPVISEA